MSDEEDFSQEENEMEVKDISNLNQEDKLAIAEGFKQIQGVGDAMAMKLVEAGYFSLEEIGAATIGDFMDRTGKSKSAAEKLISKARGMCNLGNMECAYDLIDKEKNMQKLTTGSKTYDELIGGGYNTGIVTEIHSINGHGKTQTCLTAAVMATRPVEEGGLDTNVIYMDTENTFKANRIAEIAEARGYDVKEVLSKIFVIKVYNASHQIVAMDKVRERCKEAKSRLLIVDSVICHFRAEYCGRGTLAERQQLLNKHIAELKAYAIANDAVVIVTNQMASRPDAFFGNPNAPTGGNVLQHACAYRIYIRAGKAGKRVIRLVKSPDLPEGECVVTINNKGVCDV